MQFLRGTKGIFLSRNFSPSSVVKRGSTSLLRRNIQGHFVTRQYSGLEEKLNEKFDTPETILAKVLNRNSSSLTSQGGTESRSSTKLGSCSFIYAQTNSKRSEGSLE